MIFFDFFKGFLHPRCWHLRKGAAAEAALLCEEVLERLKRGLFARGLGGGLGGGGKWVATQVVLLLEEALDGGHSCVGLCFNYFAIFSQVFIDFWWCFFYRGQTTILFWRMNLASGCKYTFIKSRFVNTRYYSRTYRAYETNEKSSAYEYLRISFLFVGSDQSTSNLRLLFESYIYFLPPHT